MEYKEKFNMAIALLNHTLHILTQYPLTKDDAKQITKEIHQLNDKLQKDISK